MKNIIIVRHGQSEANVNLKGGLSEEGEYIIDSDFELSEEGRKQAYNLRRKIVPVISANYSPKITLYVSPFKRTRDTASLLREGLKDAGFWKEERTKYIEDPRITEMDFGDFDFQLRDKWKELSPHSFYINQKKYSSPSGRFFARTENGENYLDVYNRLSLFVTTRLERELEKTDTDTHIIVTHGMAMRILKMYLLNSSIESVNEMELPDNCCGYHFVYDEYTGEYIYVGEI